MSQAGLRLDKWLWFARVVKTRSLAARLCGEGAVRLGDHPVTKPNQPVRIGDTVTVVIRGWRRVLVVRGLGVRRGPAREARLLYDEARPPERSGAVDGGLELVELWDDDDDG